MRQLATGILLILSTSVAPAADYSDGIKHAIAQLGSERSSDGRFFVVGGVTSNIGGVNGTFFLLYPFFLARATPSDVELMLHDQNPVVGILGVRRELEPAFRPLPLSSIDFLTKDQTQVRVGPFYPGGDFKTSSGS